MALSALWETPSDESQVLALLLSFGGHCRSEGRAQQLRGNPPPPRHAGRPRGAGDRPKGRGGRRTPRCTGTRSLPSATRASAGSCHLVYWPQERAPGPGGAELRRRTLRRVQPSAEVGSCVWCTSLRGDPGTGIGDLAVCSVPGRLLGVHRNQEDGPQTGVLQAMRGFVMPFAATQGRADTRSMGSWRLRRAQEMHSSGTPEAVQQEPQGWTAPWGAPGGG